MLGYKGQIFNSARARQVMQVVYALAILTMLPSIWLTYNMLRESKYKMRVDEFVAEECRFPATQVLAHNTTVNGKERTVTITLIGRQLPVDSLELALTPRLALYGLEGTHLDFIQGYSSVPQSSDSPADMRDIYVVAQNTITGQQHQIDSLRQELAAQNRANAAGVTLVPEIRVLFPQVTDIAVSRSVFADVDKASTDTVTVALVSYSRPMDAATSRKFDAYLAARLGINKVKVVTVSNP